MSRESWVDPELVRIAIRASEERQQDVADVPITALAAAAGISRSTLLRRLGGSRLALDEAVRAAGVDPGGQVPVRERAVEAAAELISEQGLANCSVYSLYATFGGRDGLLSAVFEVYSPLHEVEQLVAVDGSFEDTVARICRVFAAALDRQPQLAPAVLSDAFSRPDGPGGLLFARYFPRVLDSVGDWLSAEVEAGRVRPLPVVVLIQLLIGPLVVHVLSRPLLTRAHGTNMPDLDGACEEFGRAFVRAVAIPRSPSATAAKLGGQAS